MRKFAKSFGIQAVGMGVALVFGAVGGGLVYQGLRVDNLIVLGLGFGTLAFMALVLSAIASEVRRTKARSNAEQRPLVRAYGSQPFAVDIK